MLEFQSDLTIAAGFGYNAVRHRIQYSRESSKPLGDGATRDSGNKRDMFGCRVPDTGAVGSTPYACIHRWEGTGGCISMEKILRQIDTLVDLDGAGGPHTRTSMTLDGYFHAPPSQRHKARIPFSAAPLPAPAYPFSSVRDWHDFFHHERAALTAREQQTQYDGVVAVLCEAFSDRLKAIVLFGSAARGEARRGSDHDLLFQWHLRRTGKRWE